MSFRGRRGLARGGVCEGGGATSSFTGGGFKLFSKVLLKGEGRTFKKYFHRPERWDPVAREKEKKRTCFSKTSAHEKRGPQRVLRWPTLFDETEKRKGRVP